MEFLIVLAVLAMVVFVVTAPLRREPQSPAEPGGPSGGAANQEIAELEAAREAKYREIRDADLDYRTGKLSDADFEAVDSTLRAEAVEILRGLDRLADSERAGGAEGQEGAESRAGEAATDSD